MNRLTIILLHFICLCILIPNIHANLFYVSSQSQFDEAHENAGINDSIIWESGLYFDIYMEISKSNLYISSEELGNTIFTGRSYVTITSDYITLNGFQFINGDIGTSDVINTAGSYNNFIQLNIRGYKSYKYLVIREQCQYVNVAYCNFENRINLDDKNILSILVGRDQPGYHKIQYCSFKNFDGTGNDLGIEPIRIGLSTQANRNSRSLVEYCYFTQCNGDGEIISSKASQNVYRYNTFENNPKAELVLRHGSEAIVYGNFFLNGKGGVRVREGQNHYIYNNYFYGIDDRTIYLQNESSDPLDNINVAFNTIVNSSEIRLGGSGNYKPTNVTFANNIFTNPDDQIFSSATSNEKWIGNIAFGNLGFPVPSSGIDVIDPGLEENTEGYFGLTESSPAINASFPGYASLPQFDGMDAIDVNIDMDLMKQERPLNIEGKDLGCSEYPLTIIIQPFATEENTGPSYNTSSSTNVNQSVFTNQKYLTISPNPVENYLNLTIKNQKGAKIKIQIISTSGQTLKTLFNTVATSDNQILTTSVEELQSGIYTLFVQSDSKEKNISSTNTLRFVKM